jgi:hypothetical protein
MPMSIQQQNIKTEITAGAERNSTQFDRNYSNYIVAVG